MIVITWKYHDNSAFGVVGFFYDETRSAEKVKDFLRFTREHGDSMKTFEAHNIEQMDWQLVMKDKEEPNAHI